MRQSCNKRKKSEESKEIVLSRDQRDIKDAELMTEIDALKEKLRVFDSIKNENRQYREVLNKLIENGTLNENLERKLNSRRKCQHPI